MEQMNGFFSLKHGSDGTYLRLVPNRSDGKKISIEEVMDYLSSKRIFDYNKVALSGAIYNLGDTVEIKIMDSEILPEPESMKITITEENMEVIARFYPPSSSGSLMTKQDIISTAVSAGIKYGIIDEVLNDFLVNRIYCTDIVIAKAMLPTEGRSAHIEYFFNTAVTRKPKMNEDGTVDFHQLNLINHVKENDVLAELTPIEMGRPGIDVCGKIIRPKPVHNKPLRHGAKIKVSEDGLKLISEVSGHVYLIDDKVVVSDVYEINSDIDMSTGDIEYNGSVSIKGNVRTGFTVKAIGQIVVAGVVEGATLISEAGIILERGIQGMNRGKLITKGDVVAKFIENSTVECDGTATAEAILHSKVYAGKDIIVTGRKGFVTGGELHSGTKIHVKSAGSTMGTNTILEVGVDPKVILEYHKIEKSMNDYNKELYKVNQILDLLQKKFDNKIPPDKLSTYLAAKETYDRYTKQLEEAMARYEYLSEIIDQNESGSIMVDRIIYSGCKLIISNVVYYVREEMLAKRFIKDDVDIKVLEHTS